MYIFFLMAENPLAVAQSLQAISTSVSKMIYKI